jgi:hypothetical protein
MIGGLAAALAFGGCATSRGMFGNKAGQTWTLSTSPRLPATEGKVTVAPASDGNQTVAIEAQHLAPPAKAFDSASAYVVWIVPHGGGAPQNMGILNVGEDLKAHFETKTSYKNFDVLVTAEPDVNVTRPSGNRVMSATITTPT